MVACPSLVTAPLPPHCWALLAQAENGPVLERLPPERRAKVVAALAVLIILGALMITIAWLSARYMRRYMRGPSRLGPSGAAKGTDDDWWKKPLVDDPLATDRKEPPGD